MLRQPLADDGVGQSPPVVIAIDQQLARHGAVREGHDARVAVELGVEDEARRQPCVQRAEIAHRVPDVVCRCVDDDIFVNRCHVFLLS